MRTETITLRITREDEDPVRNWRWPVLLDCLPEHVEIVEDEMLVLHVWADAEQVYTRLGFHEFIANTDDEQYATDLSNAWQAAREAPGARVELPEYDREYVVVFTKLTEGGD